MQNLPLLPCLINPAAATLRWDEALLSKHTAHLTVDFERIVFKNAAVAHKRGTER